MIIDRIDQMLKQADIPMDELFLTNLESNIEDAIDYRRSLERDFTQFTQDDVEIINLTSDHPECADMLKQMEKLQGPTFYEEATEWVPAHKLTGQIDHGGIIIGALLQDEVIGFAEAAPAFDSTVHKSEPYLYMHLVVTHQNVTKHISNVGKLMLYELRTCALNLGYSQIQWTFDPLQPQNSNLYIRKCGANVKKYISEKYQLGGQSQDVPSDRFMANWQIKTRQVQQKMQNPDTLTVDKLLQTMPLANQTENMQEYRVNTSINQELSAPEFAVEIPVNFNKMNRESKELARKWRLQTRKIFETYFSTGYFISDFVTNYKKCHENDFRCFYLLKV
ncbi:MAG: hypothetical protein MAG795_00685 [Candidatus Woesearchaeota archaeon]|nr:hypothetical protein [Candidatus Woesearchaeota archaeon]